MSESDRQLTPELTNFIWSNPLPGRACCATCSVLGKMMVGCKHIGTRMKKMGIEAFYRKANTSRRNQAHGNHPDLLRHLTIDRPNQVWPIDTTYIPMQRGFVYLTAVLAAVQHVNG